MTKVTKNMSDVTNSAADTIVDVLDTVGTIASSVTKAVGGAATVLDMGTAFLNEARENQIARIELENDFVFERLEQEAAKELADIRADHARILSGDPEYAKLYTAARKQVSSTVDRLKAERLARRNKGLAVAA